MNWLSLVSIMVNQELVSAVSCLWWRLELGVTARSCSDPCCRCCHGRMVPDEKFFYTRNNMLLVLLKEGRHLVLVRFAVVVRDHWCYPGLDGGPEAKVFIDF